MQLLGQSREELRQLVAAWGQPAYRGDQLYQAIYRQRVSDLARVTALPSSLRERLAAECRVGWPQIEKEFRSADGTRRYLLRLADGESVEAVLMPEDGTLGGSGPRDTICLSTQAGCPVDCRFCLTALLGLKRNLTAGEIVGQVLLVARENHLEPAGRPLNLVFMGQGEPLLNYENTLAAVRLLSDPRSLGLSTRRMTLSTSGIVPGIERLGHEPVRPKLAVSLNASTDEVRTRLMPINRKWPLGSLLEACRAFPLRPRERLTFEYVLLEGINDSPADARRLVKLVAGLHAKVNLIAWNPGAGLDFRTPLDGQVLAFQRVLASAGLPAFIRKPRGRDIFAACGQLKLENSSQSPVASSQSNRI